MLVPYCLMCIYIVVFFSTFALISTGYLIGFLVKRRSLRTKAAVKDLKPAYT